MIPLHCPVCKDRLNIYVRAEWRGFSVSCSACYDAEAVDGEYRSSSLWATGNSEDEAVENWNDAVRDAA